MKKKINYEGLFMFIGILFSVIWSLCTTYWYYSDPSYQLSLSHGDRELNGCAMFVAIIGIMYYYHRYSVISRKWKK